MNIWPDWDEVHDLNTWDPWPTEEINQLIEKVEEEIKQEEEKTNVIPFLRTITGGKRPPGSNWIGDLPINTIFISKPKGFDKSLREEYKINRKTERTVQLISYPYCHMQHGLWLHEQIEFSRNNELIEVLGIEE